MSIEFGFGNYITTSRDIGNFIAGYMGGINALPYDYFRSATDWYQFIHNFRFEPPVSRHAQDLGYIWGLYNHIKKTFP